MKCKLFFAGDVVLAGHCVEDEILDKALKAEISDCDIVCCNFEAPIANDNMISQKKIGPNNHNSIQCLDALKESGFNLLTLANNHIFDYGISGIYNTIAAIQSRQMGFVGAGTDRNEIYSPYIQECAGGAIGIINFAENGFGAATEESDYGYAYIFSEEIKDQIQKARLQCDFLVAVCHAGAEMWEIPLPEWRKTYRRLIDCGVNVVVAHHPHVPQGWENYQRGLIFYSLGNFAFNKGSGVQNGRALSVLFEWNDGELRYKIIPTHFKDKKVSVCPDMKYSKYLHDLCNILRDETRYRRNVDRRCLQAFEDIYRSAYLKVACRYSGNIIEKLKGVAKRIIVPNGFQDIWLYHNITIETHYYICKRATSLMLKERHIL